MTHFKSPLASGLNKSPVDDQPTSSDQPHPAGTTSPLLLSVLQRHHRFVVASNDETTTSSSSPLAGGTPATSGRFKQAPPSTPLSSIAPKTSFKQQLEQLTAAKAAKEQQLEKGSKAPAASAYTTNLSVGRVSSATTAGGQTNKESYIRTDISPPPSFSLEDDLTRQQSTNDEAAEQDSPDSIHHIPLKANVAADQPQNSSSLAAKKLDSTTSSRQQKWAPMITAVSFANRMSMSAGQGSLQVIPPTNDGVLDTSQQSSTSYAPSSTSLDKPIGTAGEEKEEIGAQRERAISFKLQGVESAESVQRRLRDLVPELATTCSSVQQQQQQGLSRSNNTNEVLMKKPSTVQTGDTAAIQSLINKMKQLQAQGSQLSSTIPENTSRIDNKSLKNAVLSALDNRNKSITTTTAEGQESLAAAKKRQVGPQVSERLDRLIVLRERGSTLVEMSAK